MSMLASIVRGDAGNYEDIVHLLQGCQAVVSTLGQPQGGSPIFSQATGNIVRAKEAAGLRRYIAVIGQLLSETMNALSLMQRLVRQPFELSFLTAKM